MKWFLEEKKSIGTPQQGKNSETAGSPLWGASIKLNGSLVVHPGHTLMGGRVVGRAHSVISESVSTIDINFQVFFERPNSISD
jgi:hypothetical protein